MRAILWLGGLSIVGVLSLPVLDAQRRRSKHPGTPEVMINLKQIGLSLFDFGTEYGQFPDAATGPAVQSATSTTLHLGNSSSNDLFRQLIAAGLRSEKIFWAKIDPKSKKPDDVIIGAKALEKGECAFTYIAGLSSSGDPGTPVVMAPAIRGTWKFDPKPFDGKAAILFLDSSARMLPIDKNGEVILNGMNLFDPRQPYWHGKAPDIKWPE